MTGIAVHVDQNQIDSVSKHWQCGVYLSKRYSLYKMKFVVFCVSDRPVLAGKISAITSYPNTEGHPLLLEFSHLVDDPVMGDVNFGTTRDEILLLKTGDGTVDAPAPSFKRGKTKPKHHLHETSSASLVEENGNPFCE